MDLKQKYSRRTALKMLGFGSAAVYLASCAPAGAPAPASEGDAGASAEQITISISHIGGGSVEGSEASQRMQLLRESWPNINFDNQWVSYAGYLEKIPLAIASGDLADLQFCNAFNDVPLMMEADVLIDCGPLLEEHGQNILAVTPEQAWDSTLYDGRQMAVAHNVYDLNIWLTMYRGDWLEAVGLGVPQTIDEFGEVLRAFTHNDPDGNGAADTYGRVLYNTIRFDDDIFHAFGVAVGHHMNGFWRERDGALMLDWVHPQMKDALSWLRETWADGAFHPDSISIPLGHGADAFLGSFAGNAYSSWNGIDGSLARLQAVVDTATIVPGRAPEGPGGSGFTGEGWPWVYVIPKTAEHAAEAVQVLDWFYTPEIVAQVFCEGHLGETNKGLNENGWCVEFTREEKLEMGDDYANKVEQLTDITTYQGLWLPYNTVGSTPIFPNFPDDIRAHFEQILQDKYSETALEARAISQEYIRLTAKKRPVEADKESWPGLQTRFAEFISQAVAGNVDLDQGWDEWLAYFDANGGPEITEQVNQL
jgi:putative aldouronate transport system substrate-binding protein